MRVPRPGSGFLPGRLPIEIAGRIDVGLKPSGFETWLREANGGLLGRVAVKARRV